MTIFRADLDYAREMDAADELAPFREFFQIDDPDQIYLLGNSLGLLPKETVGRMQAAIEHQWGRRLIRGWNEGWYYLPERVGAKMAQLVGAQADEVIMAESTSVNLFKLSLAALKAQPGRTKIVTDDMNFPSDVYILQGVSELAGTNYCLEIVPSTDGIHGPLEGLAEAIDENTALVALSHTTFKSSYTYDMPLVTELAHKAGALILWDTSHSVGAMPIELGAAGADLAIGCSYKYVNGGPGGPAFLYVRRDLQETLGNPIAGWMGQREPFEFALEYEPTPGLRRFLSGTPTILSLAGVEPGIEMLLEAGMDRVRAKSMRQSEYMIFLWQTLLGPLGFRLNSPRNVSRRGSHVTFGHDEAQRISHTLIEEMDILPDFRAPDNIRFGVAPLYNSYADIHAAMMGLRMVVVDGLYEKYPLIGDVVT